MNVWIGAPSPTAIAGFLDGIGTNVRLYYPMIVNISPNGTFALFIEENNHAIRKIIMSTGTVSIFAGAYPTAESGYVNGIGTNARFYSLWTCNIS